MKRKVTTYFDLEENGEEQIKQLERTKFSKSCLITFEYWLVNKQTINKYNQIEIRIGFANCIRLSFYHRLSMQFVHIPLLMLRDAQSSDAFLWNRAL